MLNNGLINKSNFPINWCSLIKKHDHFGILAKMCSLYLTERKLYQLNPRLIIIEEMQMALRKVPGGSDSE